MKLNLFDKKKEGKHVPVAEVEGMLRTGTPETVIRSRLKEEKYSSEDVNKAIEQAKIKLGATGVPSSMKAPWEQVAGQQQELGDEPQGLTGQPAPPIPSFPPPSRRGAPASYDAPIPQENESAPWEKGAPEVGKYSIEDLETVIQPLIEGLKLEMDSKIDSISGELKKVSTTEKKLEKVLAELNALKTQLSAKQKSGGNYDEELAQLKGSVNSILEIMKGTLPPIIKSLKELKGENATLAKKKKEVEHLI